MLDTWMVRHDLRHLARKVLHSSLRAIRSILHALSTAQVISRGMQHRRTGSHELNMESSRSHSIMTVYCNAAAEEDDSGASLATMGKISFVDLVSPLQAFLLMQSRTHAESTDSLIMSRVLTQHLCLREGIPSSLTTCSAKTLDADCEAQCKALHGEAKSKAFDWYAGWQ